MKLADVEIIGSIDPSEMPPVRGPQGRHLSPATQRILDDAKAGLVTVFRLSAGSTGNDANAYIQGGMHRTLRKRGFTVQSSTKFDTDGTLLLYVHCTPIEQNGHQS